jgi:DNA invertase Pin-like site-specific DNA recombinase
MLNAYNCHRTDEEDRWRVRAEDPALRNMIEKLRKGDVVVVAWLDRLVCLTRDLLELAEPITVAGASLN